MSSPIGMHGCCVRRISSLRTPISMPWSSAPMSVRPVAADEQAATQVRPLHLGFTLWEEIIRAEGIETTRQEVVREDDNFRVLRNYGTQKRAADMGLFRYREAARHGAVQVLAGDIDELRDTLFSGDPQLRCPAGCRCCSSQQRHARVRRDSDIDKRGLDVDRAGKVLEYIAHVWRRPAAVEDGRRTGDDRRSRGRPCCCRLSPSASGRRPPADFGVASRQHPPPRFCPENTNAGSQMDPP